MLNSWKTDRLKNQVIADCFVHRPNAPAWNEAVDESVNNFSRL